jgi:hypothetical protein
MCSGPTPVQVIQLSTPGCIKICYNYPHEAQQIIRKGSIDIFKRSYAVAAPSNKKKGICKICKYPECTNQKCRNIRCGRCAGPHDTPQCPSCEKCLQLHENEECPTDTPISKCVACCNFGHTWDKCPHHNIHQ